jgi:hypothetical protein
MDSTKKQSKKTEPQEEVYRPMGVPEPVAIDRLEALEARVAVLENLPDKIRVIDDKVTQHNRYHFGKVT